MKYPTEFKSILIGPRTGWSLHVWIVWGFFQSARQLTCGILRAWSEPPGTRRRIVANESWIPIQFAAAYQVNMWKLKWLLAMTSNVRAWNHFVGSSILQNTTNTIKYHKWCFLWRCCCYITPFPHDSCAAIKICCRLGPEASAAGWWEPKGPGKRMRGAAGPLPGGWLRSARRGTLYQKYPEISEMIGL